MVSCLSDDVIFIQVVSTLFLLAGFYLKPHTPTENTFASSGEAAFRTNATVAAETKVKRIPQFATSNSKTLFPISTGEPVNCRKVNNAVADRRSDLTSPCMMKS